MLAFIRSISAFVALVVALAGCGATAPTGTTAAFDPSTWTLELSPVVKGLVQPVHVANAGDNSHRLFVVEKRGRIRVVANGVLQAQPFLTITNLVGFKGGEQGLLSVAFHPAFRTNGYFFVAYTDKVGDVVIARYHAAPDAETADAGSAMTLLRIDQPTVNHNGGQLAFGPDGYLYAGTGDGDGAGDKRDNAQNRGSLLGKLLRLDVDHAAPYAIPPDNPFVGVPRARPEIWATGLRNPWRFSFDRATGDLFIADVGENAREEVDFQPAGSRGGQNYGWNIMEGSRCSRPAMGCNRNGLVLPIAEYGHDQGCSITGGFRYRGRDVPAFGNAYFFADYCSGQVWALTRDIAGAWTKTKLLDTELQITSFGEDERGELYLVDFLTGVLYRLGAAAR